jgi:hypothetical protein
LFLTFSTIHQGGVLESSYYIATFFIVSEVEDYQSSEYGMQAEYSKTCYVDGLVNSSEEANNRPRSHVHGDG